MLLTPRRVLAEFQLNYLTLNSLVKRCVPQSTFLSSFCVDQQQSNIPLPSITPTYCCPIPSRTFHWTAKSMTSLPHQSVEMDNLACVHHSCDKLVLVESDMDPQNMQKICVLVILGDVKVKLERDKNEPLQTALNRLAVRLQNEGATNNDKTSKKKKKGMKEANQPPQAKKVRRGTDAQTTSDQIAGLERRTSAETSGEVCSLDDAPSVSKPDDVVLYRPDGSAMSPESLTCGDAFRNTRRVRINGEDLLVIHNLPKLAKARIAGDVVVGLPCVLSCECIPSTCSLEEFTIEWYSAAGPKSSNPTPTSSIPTTTTTSRSPIPATTTTTPTTTSSSTGGQTSQLVPRRCEYDHHHESDDQLKSQLVHVGQWFTPRPEDVGVKLLVKGKNLEIQHSTKHQIKTFYIRYKHVLPKCRCPFLIYFENRFS